MQTLAIDPVRWVAFALLGLSSSGCAAFSESAFEGRIPSSLHKRNAAAIGVPAVESVPSSGDGQGGVALAEGRDEPGVGIPSVEQPSADQPTDPEAKTQAPEEAPLGEPIPPEAPVETDEPYDPFAKSDERGTAEIEEYDPWEPFNMVTFEFNWKFDRYVLKPVATVYDKVMPDPLERGISNLFHNMGVVPRLLNNVAQAKFKGAGLEVGRFLINSTIGIGGLFDPAKHLFGLDTPDEDTGQTLGVYGIKPGPYLVIPLLPPMTLRDAAGLVADFVLDPVNYFLFANIRVGQHGLVMHQFTAWMGNFGMRVGQIVNDRSLSLEKFQGVEEATVDLYSAVRNAYLQKRAKAVRE